MKTVRIVAATLLAEMVIFIIFIQMGLYNVSTDSPDPRPISWIFSATSDNSIEHHARGITAPSLVDSSMIKEGFDHYDAMCVGCHGAPGVDRSEIGKGLYPRGPNLANSAKEMTPEELFWVVKNGIKSTGMPAFGKTHSDEKVWAIVAFLEKMKDMTPQEYATM
jgi:mono/diheme cytochrome c family protein